MKFFFSKTDNLYKIFKTIEKIPSSRDIEIFIDPDHTIFENEWWWKQIHEILIKKNINATFVTKNKKNKEYYENLGMKVNYEGNTPLKKFLSIVSVFLFDIKKFHLYAYETKKYVFVLLSFFELLFVLWIVWIVVSLIIPHATITIYPAEESDLIIYNFRYYPHNDTMNIEEKRYLNIPYYTWTLDYEYELSISTSNIKHVTHPSIGYIKIFNTKDLRYSLLAGTRFVTQDWLIFRAVDSFIVGSWTEENPSQTVIQVQADEFDEKEQMIWVRGNISAWTKLWIRNLNESYYFREIWAEALDPFQWWSTESIWSITQEDLDVLSGKLVEQMYKQKLNVVGQYFPISWWIFLDFESITSTHFNSIEIHDKVWDKTPFLKGTANVTYTFTYVLREDLIRIFKQYLLERNSETTKVARLNENDITFIKDRTLLEEWDLKKNGDIYIIPTQISFFQEYDFAHDLNWILPVIKSTVAWMSLDNAKNYLLTNYEEIWNVSLSLSPFWNNVIPTIKSRIKIDIVE